VSEAQLTVEHNQKPMLTRLPPAAVQAMSQTTVGSDDAVLAWTSPEVVLLQ
jgi:hypothetical protein